jgi:Mrp family chromosome partitioning ATPase
MATRQSRGQDDLAAEPRSVELRDYVLVVRRRWVIVLMAIVLGGALGAGYSVYKGNTYAATSQVVVEPATQGPLNPPAQPNLQVNMVTEQAVAESASVAAQAAQLMHSPLSGAVAQGRLASRLTVTVPLLSNVLQITWHDKSPRAAQQGADAFANAYLTYRHNMLAGQITRLDRTLSDQVTALQRQIKSVSGQENAAPSGSTRHQTLDARLNQLNGQLTKANDTLSSLPTYNVSGGNVISASLPLSPDGIGRSTILLLGALLGLLAGIVLAFIRDAFDDRLRDPVVLERKLGAPTLAIVPGMGSSRRVHGADTVRALRTTLTSVAATSDVSSVVVVGADSSVSSSQVAAELSVALAESGRRTLLIAADIRGSSLAQIFGLPNSTGLTNVLTKKADLADVTQYPKQANGNALSRIVARQLVIIPSGPPIAQPLSVLDSVAMAKFLKSLRNIYDFVVLDCPPADAAADFLALARLVDGVVAVASEGRSRGRAADDLRRRLDRIGGYVAVGVLLVRSRMLRRRSRADRDDADLISGRFAARQADGPGGDRAELTDRAARAAFSGRAARPGAADRAPRGPVPEPAARPVAPEPEGASSDRVAHTLPFDAVTPDGPPPEDAGQAALADPAARHPSADPAARHPSADPAARHPSADPAARRPSDPAARRAATDRPDDSDWPQRLARRPS